MNSILYACKKQKQLFRDFDLSIWDAAMSNLTEEDQGMANYLLCYIVDRFKSRPFHRISARKNHRSDGDHILKTCSEDNCWAVLQTRKKQLNFHFYDQEDRYQHPEPFAASWSFGKQGKEKKRSKNILLSGKHKLFKKFIPLLDDVHDNAAEYYGRLKNSTEKLKLLFGSPQMYNGPLLLPNDNEFEKIINKYHKCSVCDQKDKISLFFNQETGEWKIYCDQHHPRKSDWIETGQVVIPHEVKRHVWHRDGGKCLTCGSDFQLHFDHIIPRDGSELGFSGSNTENNIQLKCRSCNLTKQNKLII